MTSIGSQKVHENVLKQITQTEDVLMRYDLRKTIDIEFCYFVIF